MHGNPWLSIYSDKIQAENLYLVRIIESSLFKKWRKRHATFHPGFGTCVVRPVLCSRVANPPVSSDETCWRRILFKLQKCMQNIFSPLCQFLLGFFGMLHPLFLDSWFVLTGVYFTGNQLGLQK